MEIPRDMMRELWELAKEVSERERPKQTEARVFVSVLKSETNRKEYWLW
jgi:hypothetical protein